MTPVLSFTRGELGRELVRLGQVVIGEVAPYHGGRRYSATFLLRLPEIPSYCFQPAHSIDEARQIVRREVSEWLLRAGVFYPGQEVDVIRPGEDAGDE